MLAGALTAVCLVAGLAATDPGGVATVATLSAIHGYRATLARAWPLLGITCRFHPTCSYYAEEAISRYGVVRGGWLSLRRVLRCGPWTPPDTADPVAAKNSAPAAAGRAREAPHPP